MARVEAISDDAQAAVILSVQDVVERSARCSRDDAPHLMEVPWIATDQMSMESADTWLPAEVAEDTLGGSAIHVRFDWTAQGRDAHTRQSNAQLWIDHIRIRCGSK